ncbi:uncharacterized protein LOC102386397 [Alligator sinensis]|uniref:Uncharacterized protein LOC102386397 n=1 Tax=Alligator sinensis TaxID=38654 RepID=A0A1U8DYZ3_ALLSI|nr:uncharacterized protein LOC102386397 [Alligator sinensis]
MATVAGRTDAWALRLGGLLLFLLVLETAGSQLQVTTVPSSTAHVGSGALLQCRFDVGGPVALDSLRVTWYFWKKKVAWYEPGRSQAQPGASLPSEKALQSGDASLSPAVVTVSDGGLYRCVVGYGAQQHPGNTTLRLLAAPTISIPREPAVANVETSLLCHVGRFFPKDVDVAWLRDGQVLEGSTRSSPQTNPDGTFNLTLTYTFTPARSDAGSVFSCRVRHAALGQSLQEDVPLVIPGGLTPRPGGHWLRRLLQMRAPQQREVGSAYALLARGKQVARNLAETSSTNQPSPCDKILSAENKGFLAAMIALAVVSVVFAAIIVYLCVKRRKGWTVPYSVSELQVPEKCLLGEEVTLRCSMEGTFPEHINATWERIRSKYRTVSKSAADQESSELQPILPALPMGWRVTEERTRTHLTSSLTFTPTLQDDGARVRCVFLHEAKRIREERVSPEIRVWARPQVSEIQVLPEWDPRDKVPFAVQLHNFYPREVPLIQWGWDGAENGGEDPAQIDKTADGTFTAMSIWRVPTWCLTRPELRVRVCVQQGPGEPPSERELSLRAAGLLRPPDVSEISQTESVATGKGVTLSCRIAGHFPGELSVTWLRRNKGKASTVILRDSAECRVEPGTAVLARDGKSFQQETRLILWTSRDKGAEYTCRVDHLTLQTCIEKSWP